MSKEEIKELIGEVLDERIDSAIEKVTKRREEFSDRKDLIMQKEVSQDDPRIKALDTEIHNLDIGIMLLKSLKG